MTCLILILYQFSDEALATSNHEIVRLSHGGYTHASDYSVYKISQLDHEFDGDNIFSMMMFY